MSCMMSCSASRSKCCCATGLNHSRRFTSLRIATPSGNAAVACSMCCSSSANSCLVWLCRLTILYSWENASSQIPPASGMVSMRASFNHCSSLNNCRARCAITISNTTTMNNNARVAENMPHNNNAASVLNTTGKLTRNQKSCKINFLTNRKTITAAAHGLNQAIHFDRLQRGAQSADVHIHGTLLDEHLRAPHLVEQLRAAIHLSLIHISEPTRLGMISYAVFCLKKKKKT